jgi:hypothetical protein
VITGIIIVGLGLWIIDSSPEMVSASKLIMDMIVDRFQCLLSQVINRISANKRKGQASQDQIKASQEGLRATVRTGQEKMEATISTIHPAQTKLKDIC